MCLCDTSGEEDIHINDVLVEEGYAEFVPDGKVEETGEAASIDQQQIQDAAQGAAGSSSQMPHNEKVNIFHIDLFTYNESKRFHLVYPMLQRS